MIWYRRTVAANCSIYLQCRCKRRNGRYISSLFWSFILTPRRKTDSIKDLYYPKLTRVNGVLITFFVTLTFLILSTAEEKNKSDCWCEIEDQVRKLRYGIRKAFNLSLTPFLQSILWKNSAFRTFTGNFIRTLNHSPMKQKT